MDWLNGVKKFFRGDIDEGLFDIILPYMEHSLLIVVVIIAMILTDNLSSVGPLITALTIAWLIYTLLILIALEIEKKGR